MPFASGFLLGLSLIVAIGAQNAFILRQGLLRRHVFVLCLICALSDAALIAAGVAGLGTLIAQSPRLIVVVTAGGALFLFVYAAVAFRRAVNPAALTYLAFHAVAAGNRVEADDWMQRVARQPRIAAEPARRLAEAYRAKFGREWRAPG